MTNDPIPCGYCQCGCGQETAVITNTSRPEGRIKGERSRYVSGHNPHHRKFEPLETRYEERNMGHSSPCWFWMRSTSRKGYGMMWSPEAWRVVAAHRYYYERFIGAIPDGLQIDHLCRVRACVNPWHLEPVTQPVNQQRGANAKLTRAQADEIRRRGLVGIEGRRQGVQSGESIKALSREFGVSVPVISGIIQGRLWPST